MPARAPTKPFPTIAPKRRGTLRVVYPREAFGFAKSAEPRSLSEPSQSSAFGRTAATPAASLGEWGLESSRLTRSLDDHALIERVQSGDRMAFRDFFRRYREDVARIVLRTLGPNADHEDVVQDVFIQLYRSLKGFRGDSKFSTWLYRLTLNVARMHARKERVRPPLAMAESSEHFLGTMTSDERPDGSAERNERVAALYRLLQRIADKKREVLIMHDLDGKNAAEIAEIVDAPLLTVRTRLFYARKELYTLLTSEPSIAEALKSELQPPEDQAAIESSATGPRRRPAKEAL